ncbi:MAG: 3-keto-5-aminohexanoate cleavage protein, partial [Proteobacteria bacterium]|nr:3-keto-5-aminohexanoate cleavage protein [Pseudomonadota bacterium]
MSNKVIITVAPTGSIPTREDNPNLPYTAEEVAAEIRRALEYIPVEQLIVSSDCGFGRQGCNRGIAFYKASAL